jgi:integral membrane protein
MGAMKDFFDLSTPAKRFRFVAVLEAITWLGLLVGMFFKYVPESGSEIGVKIFGPIHGAVFVAFVAVAILTAVALRWNWWVTALALLASVPPFGTVVFEVWAARSGYLAELSTGGRALAKETARR